MENERIEYGIYTAVGEGEDPETALTNARMALRINVDATRQSLEGKHSLSIEPKYLNVSHQLMHFGADENPFSASLAVSVEFWAPNEN